MRFTVQQMCPGVTAVAGEIMRYLVESHSRPGTRHLVDLAAYNGFGRCQCEDFSTRHNPKLREGAKPLAYLECKHIRRARRYLAIEVAQAIIEKRLAATNQNRRNNGQKAHRPDQEAPAY